MLTTRVAPSPQQVFAAESAGLDYFATDFHYMNVAAEIRRQLARQRGFVLLSGPPEPDGKLIERYLDGTSATDPDAMGHRATLVRCRQGWTFGDVIIAYGRQLGLSPDAGAWPILSQVMQESRRGLTRILIIDNADALDDGSFDELCRFTRLDDPYVLPVVLLAGASFPGRLETGLEAIKPAIVAVQPVQHLMPGEVAAFIRYQVEPLGDGYAAAFAPETIAAITEAAQGDPRVVNRLARQSLDRFSHSQAPAAPIPPAAPEARTSSMSAAAGGGEVTRRMAAPVVEPLAVDATPMRPSAPAPASRALTPVRPSAPRSSQARLARNLVAAACLLFVGVYAVAILYTLLPQDTSPQPTEATATPAASTAPAAPAPVQAAIGGNTAPRPPAASKTAVVEPPSSPVPPSPKIAAPAEPPPSPKVATAAVPPPPAPAEGAKNAAGSESLAAAAQQAATIEPSAPPPAKSAAVAERSRTAPPPAPAATAAPAAGGATPLVERGDRLLASGDIAAARQFYERAVEAGDAEASCGLGKSYDPLFLHQIATHGVAADPGKAAVWYRRAAQAGSSEATTLLARLAARYPSVAPASGSSQ